MTYKDFINSALLDVSEIAQSYFGKVSGSVKGEDPAQVLTEADLAVGKKLIEIAQEAYPDFNIIDEEQGAIDKGSEFTWVFDPICGTSNFAQKSPIYAINVGLLKGGTPIAGGTAIPYFGEICVAEKGSGTTCNGVPLKLENDQKINDVLMSFAFDGDRTNPTHTRDACKLLAELVLNIRNLRAGGSMFDAVMVAKGVYGLYLNATCRIWDIVGACAYIEEAGGVCTDLYGAPLDFSAPISKYDKPYNFCLGGNSVHAAAQDIIKRVLAGRGLGEAA